MQFIMAKTYILKPSPIKKTIGIHASTCYLTIMQFTIMKDACAAHLKTSYTCKFKLNSIFFDKYVACSYRPVNSHSISSSQAQLLELHSSKAYSYRKIV